MGILDEIKRASEASGAKVQGPEETLLEKKLNSLFYLPPNPELEGEFVTNVMTRGTGDTERVGLHASNMLVGDDVYCLRAMVLSMEYRQLQGEEVPLNVKRIFEEGNAVHEKWQRLFLRAGYSAVRDLDRTRLYPALRMSYSPDAIVSIPELFDGAPMVCEIKSVNMYAYEKQQRHPSAWKQCHWYMYLGGWDYGFVLRENKNNQQFAVEVYRRDDSKIEKYIERADEIVVAHERLVKRHKLVRRPDEATSPNCDLCDNCVMRDVCWKLTRPERIGA